MNKVIRIVFAIFCTVLLLQSSNKVYAINVLPDGFLIGDTDGIHVNSQGEYFIYEDNMTPEEVIHKTLIINNTEKSTYKLSMTVTPLEEFGPINMLDKIHLRLILDGEEVYNGRVRGDEGINMVVNALPLGTYSYGDMKKMQIELSLDKNIPREMFREKSIGEIRWNFYAVKDESSAPPKTGEKVQDMLIILCVILMLSSVLIIALKKEARKTTSQDELGLKGGEK